MTGSEREPEGDWGPPRSKQVTWHDPMAASARGAQVSGLEYLQGVLDGVFPPPPIANLMSFRLVSIEDGEAVFRGVPDESVYNPSGVVHGGWLCAMLDSAAGCAAHSCLPAGARYSTIEIKVSFLKAVRANAGAVEALGRVLRQGRQVIFAEAHARNERGELVGHATTSLAVVPAP